MEASRTKKAMLNVATTIVCQLILAITNIFIRKIIIEYIGIEIFGIEGLFSSLINLIFTIELGVSSASSYYYALAISKNDSEDLMKTYTSFRTLYKYISICIILATVVLTFNLDRIITSSIVDDGLLRIFFIISCLTRLFTFYKAPYELLIIYHEKQYKIQIIYLVAGITFSLLKLFLVYFFKDYTLYLLLILSETFITYILLRKESKKLLNTCSINKKELFIRYRQILKYGIKIFFNGYLCSLFGSKDNIIITWLFGNNGLLQIAKISNYNTIFLTISSFANSAISAMRASVINFINDSKVNSKENMLSVFKIILFITYILGSFCFIGLFGLSTPFIKLFYGNNYVVKQIYVFILSMNLFLELFIVSLQLYLTGKGMIDKENKFLPISISIGILFSAIFAYLFGPLGTYIGTTIGYFVRILFLSIVVSDDLKINIFSIFKEIIKYVLCLMIFSILTCWLIDFYPNSIISFGKNILLFVMLFALAIALFYNSKEFKYIKEMIINYLSKH